MGTNDHEDDFELVIDFVPDTGDPGRAFKAMASLVASFEELDKNLIVSIDQGIDARFVLSEVQSGSIRAIFRNVLSDLPDEALRNGEWKKVVGHYLVKAKYLILDWCSHRDAIDSREDVKVLERDLMQTAEQTNIKLLPAYAPVSSSQLLAGIRSIQQSLQALQSEDRAFYQTAAGAVELNSKLAMSEQLVRDVLTKEVVETHGIRIVQVKKPDYLGRSQWSLRHDGHKIEASILDKEWLDRFQGRLVDVRPGDSLKVDMREWTYYGYDNEIVHRSYAIDHVIDIVKPLIWKQVDMF